MGDFGFFYIKRCLEIYYYKREFVQDFFFKIFLWPKKPLRLGQRKSLAAGKAETDEIGWKWMKKERMKSLSGATAADWLSLFKDVGGCVCVCLTACLRVACVECGQSRRRVWSGGAKRPLMKKGQATVNEPVHSAACTTRGCVPSGTAKHTARRPPPWLRILHTRRPATYTYPPPFRSTPAVSLHQIIRRGMDGRRMRNSFPLSSPS